MEVEALFESIEQFPCLGQIFMCLQHCLQDLFQGCLLYTSVYRLMAWTYTLIREDPNACMHVFVVAALASVAATALATGSWQRICEVGFSLCAAAALWIPHEFMMQADSASPMASSFTAIAQFSAAAVTTFAVVLAATSGVALIVVTARAIHARLAQPLARRRDSLIKD